jgi:hypothetical protein
MVELKVCVICSVTVLMLKTLLSLGASELPLFLGLDQDLVMLMLTRCNLPSATSRTFDFIPLHSPVLIFPFLQMYLQSSRAFAPLTMFTAQTSLLAGSSFVIPAAPTSKSVNLSLLHFLFLLRQSCYSMRMGNITVQAVCVTVFLSSLCFVCIDIILVIGR